MYGRKKYSGGPVGDVRKKNLQKLREYCIWLLGRRSYSTHELETKMKVYAENPQDIKTVLDSMTEYGYVNDAQFAQNLLKAEVAKGRGVSRIRKAFQNKGIELDMVQDSLQEVDWFEKALELKIRKFGEVVERDPQKRAKQMRFLQYRGFSFDVIQKVVNYNNFDA